MHAWTASKQPWVEIPNGLQFEGQPGTSSDPKRLDPTRTATAIARVRDAESELPLDERLFEDPFARYFDDVHLEVQGVFDALPFFREQVRLRTRYLDDCVREALEGGTRRVVLLGAGFDMRAARMHELSADGVEVVELDHGELLERKRKRLEEVGVEIPPNVHYAAADLMGDASTIEAALRQGGVDGNERVLWLAEGLFGYLSADAITRMGKVAASLSASGSLLVGNYFRAAFTLKALADRLVPAGWHVEAGPAFAELHRRHIGPGVPSGSESFGLLRATC